MYKSFGLLNVEINNSAKDLFIYEFLERPETFEGVAA
jgi:hypothetical protein